MLKAESYTFKARDGKEIGYTLWPIDKNEPIKGVVQIAHGIGEHIGRYEEVAVALNREGFVVYGNDHRGHGLTANNGKTLGQYEGESFWEDTIEDLREMTELIKSEHPNSFFIFLGHSLGSLLGRDYISRFGGMVDAVIISGTAGYIKFLGPAGVAITNLLRRFKGSSATSPLIESFFFDQFNRKFKPNRTKLDWISRDELRVDKFAKDPLRSEKFSIGILYGAALGGKMANAPETFQNTPKDLPMYIFSGDQDPVGEMGAGVKRVYRDFKNAGMKNLTLKLYPGGRHEMFNEVNRKEVVKEMVNWIHKVIAI